ncbi:hypothetical protein D3C81_1307490 [compost metagenome]
MRFKDKPAGCILNQSFGIHLMQQQLLFSSVLLQQTFIMTAQRLEIQIVPSTKQRNVVFLESCNILATHCINVRIDFMQKCDLVLFLQIIYEVLDTI